MELEKFEMELMQQIVNDVKSKKHHQRMQKMQLSHELASINQLKRIENQRQHLILAERQLNDRQSLMKIIIDTREIHLKRALCYMIKSVRIFSLFMYVC